MFLLNGNPLALDVAFTDADGIQRPANWLRLASPEERAAIGITEVADPAPYDQRFYWGYDADGELIPKQLNDEPQVDENGDPVLSGDGQPIVTTGLKTLWKSTTAQTANTLLAPTDWYVTRETDTGNPCPAEIRAWRQYIREAAKDKVASIDGCETVADLAAYVTGNVSTLLIADPETGDLVPDPDATIQTPYSAWPVQPAPAPSTTPAPDYRTFYDALLVSEAYGVIRDRAVTNPSVLTACVEFIAAIGDAKSGRPNPPAIQACIDLLCAAAQFTPAELAGLSAVLSVGGLDQVYTVPLS